MNELFCPDCYGGCAVKRDRDRGRWRITVWHLPTCPALRTARMRRAVDRYLTDMLAASVALAHYGDEIEGRHRVVPAGAR